MRVVLLVIALGGLGCSLARTPVVARAVDAGAPELDAPAPEDGFVVDDAPVEVDAPPPPSDAPFCVPGCAGSVLTTCTAPPVDCAVSGEVCSTTPSPHCEAPPCVSGTTRCSADGRASLTCSGGVLVPTFCDGYGCDGTGGLCASSCDIPDEFVAGASRFDLCVHGADNQNLTVTGACQVGADGDDRMGRLVVPVRSHLDATVRDDDPSADVDVVLYLRRVCDDRDEQITCDDDVPCGDAPSSLGTCFSGNQWRQARIVADLEPGTYYLVADSIDDFSNDTDWTCGFVSLSVALTPL